MKGAIVRHRDGGRHRAVLGEQIDNWRLISVSVRSAQFESVADGSVAELSMGLARIQALPVAVAPGKSAVLSGEKSSAEPEEEAEPKLMTFEGYYGEPRSKDK
jgi:hypothetical protein